MFAHNGAITGWLYAPRTASKSQILLTDFGAEISHDRMQPTREILMQNYSFHLRMEFHSPRSLAAAHKT